MPRLRRKGHAQRGPHGLTRAETIAALIADPWGVLARGAAHELLAGFPPAECDAILAEVEHEEWRRRQVERRKVLLERLRTWSTNRWCEIFGEMPELKRELTPEQRAQWAAWRNGELTEPRPAVEAPICLA